MPIMTRAQADTIIDTGNPLPETHITLPEVWRAEGPEGYERDVLAGIWRIGPLSLHVRAFAVVLVCGQDEDGADIEVAWDSDDAYVAEMELTPGGAARMFSTAELWQAHGMEGHAETIEIEGRRYIVFASPFCT